MRYFGYATELGETFRYVAPWFVRPSYFLSFSYVFADTADKTFKQYKAQGDDQSIYKPLVKSMDCLTWQLLASELLPCAVINRIVWLSRWII